MSKALGLTGNPKILQAKSNQVECKVKLHGLQLRHRQVSRWIAPRITSGVDNLDALNHGPKQSQPSPDTSQPFQESKKMNNVTMPSNGRRRTSADRSRATA